MVEQLYDPNPGQAEALEDNISSSDLDRSATVNDVILSNHEADSSLADHSSYRSTAHIISKSQMVSNGDEILIKVNMYHRLQSRPMECHVGRNT